MLDAVSDHRSGASANTASIYREFVAKGDRGGAVEYFMAKVVGMPAEFVAGARSQPRWAWTEALAHTLADDAQIMADYALPEAKAARVMVPTVVIDGGASFGFMGPTADALANALSNGERRTLAGQ